MTSGLSHFSGVHVNDSVIRIFRLPFNTTALNVPTFFPSMAHVPVSVREQGWLQEPDTKAVTTFLSFSSFNLILPTAGFFFPLPDLGMKVAETSLIFAELPPIHLPAQRQRSMSPLATGPAPTAATDGGEPGVPAIVGAELKIPPIKSTPAAPETAMTFCLRRDLIKINTYP